VEYRLFLPLPKGSDARQDIFPSFCSMPRRLRSAHPIKEAFEIIQGLSHGKPMIKNERRAIGCRLSAVSTLHPFIP
jgi:hypothetical protein